MEIPTVFRLETLSTRRLQVCMERSGDIGVELIEVLQLMTRQQHPLGIAEDADLQFRMRETKTIELRHRCIEFLGAPRIENHHIALGSTESLGKVCLANIKIGNFVGNILRFETATQSKGKDTLLTGSIVTVDKYRMGIAEVFHKMIDKLVVLFGMCLINLEDITIDQCLVRIDRERYP